MTRRKEINMKQNTTTKSLIALVLLGAAVLPVQAELGNGDTLHFGTGSKVSMEVSPGFWVDIPIAASTGLIIGEAQTDNGIDAPFHLFEQPTQHQSIEPVAVIGADAGSAALDFSAWAMSWRGAVILLGAGGDNEQGEGVAAVECDNGCSKGETFRLDYSATLPTDAVSLAGLPYRLQLVGTIE
jgi:hypothetical protein